LRKADDEGANLLVVSDHGFMKADKKFNILHFLEDLDLLDFRDEQRNPSRLYRIAQPLLSTPLRKPLKVIHDYYEEFTGESLDDTEDSIIETISPDSKVLPSWEPVGRDIGLKINDNLSESQKEEIKQRLEDRLSNLKYQGEKVAEKVWKGEELYSESANRPDIAFRTTQEFIPDTLTSKMTFVNTLSFTHDVSGIFYAKGPNINVGSSEKIDILDVAPLIYVLLGEDIPDDLDGELPEDIVKGLKASYTSDELRDLDF
jgi:predicted AlkP superfamily phosphohydrolase/phosphomutase